MVVNNSNIDKSPSASCTPVKFKPYGPVRILPAPSGCSSSECNACPGWAAVSVKHISPDGLMARSLLLQSWALFSWESACNLPAELERKLYHKLKPASRWDCWEEGVQKKPGMEAEPTCTLQAHWRVFLAQVCVNLTQEYDVRLAWGHCCNACSAVTWLHMAPAGQINLPKIL